MKSKKQVNWYDLREMNYIYLKGNTLKNLIKKGVKKAGSLSRFNFKLNSNYSYVILKENKKGWSVKKLKEILSYLNINYNYLNNKIENVCKGDKISIKNPKFPIDIKNKRMDSLMGHIVSDGCLYYDKCRKNFIRTKYCSGDEQSLKEFIGCINSVFGTVHYNSETVRNCKIIRYGNSFVGETLSFAGGIIGKKYVMNGSIPWVVKEGCMDTKRAYLSAIFDDEGSAGYTDFPYVILSRNIHTQFNNKEKNKINKFLIPLMKNNKFPTGHITQRIPIGKIKKVLKEKNEMTLLDKIINSKPKILLDESSLLKESFGIKNYVYTTSLQITSKGNYSVQSNLVIRSKENVGKFYKNVGFNLSRKQDKLKQFLEKGGKCEIKTV